uniref:Uncharacterized protein n=1 Tax=Nelumbo nucifera TaxID=4432 RepID=A0A822Z6A7_NELNU|nr:TPA_asm: hypothetical protein HUJ06_007709 [Nelumbo nucifera]
MCSSKDTRANWDGGGFDPVIGTMNWSGEQWDDYLKSHSRAKQFKHLGLQWVNECRALFQGACVTQQDSWGPKVGGSVQRDSLSGSKRTSSGTPRSGSGLQFGMEMGHIDGANKSSDDHGERIGFMLGLPSSRWKKSRGVDMVVEIQNMNESIKDLIDVLRTPVQ